MFENLPYSSKLEICKLYFIYKFKINISSSILIRFSWNNIELENNNNCYIAKKNEIVKWYSSNLKLIRKHKFLSIAKREIEI